MEIRYFILIAFLVVFLTIFNAFVILWMNRFQSISLLGKVQDALTIVSRLDNPFLALVLQIRIIPTLSPFSFNNKWHWEGWSIVPNISVLTTYPIISVQVFHLPLHWLFPKLKNSPLSQVLQPSIKIKFNIIMPNLFFMCRIHDNSFFTQ